MDTPDDVPTTEDWDRREAAFYIQKFSQLLTAIRDIEACENEDAVLLTLIAHIIDVGFSNVMLSLLCQHEKPPVIRAVKFYGDEWQHIVPLTVRPYPGQDLLPQILMNGEPKYIPDSRADKRNDELAVAMAGIVSQFVVPLQTRDMKIGTIQVHMGHRPVKPIMQCQLLETLGAHASLAIGRIRSVIRFRDADTQIISFSMLATAGAIASGVVHQLKGEMGAVRCELARIVKEREYRNQGKSKAVLERLSQRISQWSQKVQNPLELLSDVEESQVCAVNQIVLEMISNWYLDAETRNCRLKFKPYAKHTVNVCVRPSHIRALLSCLIVNALQAYAKNITIALNEAEDQCGCEEEDVDRCAVITIADDGVGIAANHATRIFDLGFTTKEKGGTGYGLYFAERLATAMSGRLTLESAGRASGRPETVFKLVVPTDRSSATHA